MKKPPFFPARFPTLLCIIKGRQVWHANWTSETTLLLPFREQPFACILWNNRIGYVSETLLEQLLSADCKYLVIGGNDCERWHDKADHLHLEFYAPDYIVPDEEDVMTTWHTGDPLEEVLEFGLLSASDYKGQDFANYLIVQVDPEASREQLGRMIDEILG